MCVEREGRREGERERGKERVGDNYLLKKDLFRMRDLELVRLVIVREVLQCNTG